MGLVDSFLCHRTLFRKSLWNICNKQELWECRNCLSKYLLNAFCIIKFRHEKTLKSSLLGICNIIGHENNYIY